MLHSKDSLKLKLYLTGAADGRYYKRVKSLPATWKYVSATASALVAPVSDTKFEAICPGAKISVVSGHLLNSHAALAARSVTQSSREGPLRRGSGTNRIILQLELFRSCPHRKPAVSVISFAETRVARPLAKLGLRSHRACLGLMVCCPGFLHDFAVAGLVPFRVQGLTPT